MRENVAISARVLDVLGAARGVLYLSSGAVYQPGGIDENPYAALKRMDELAFRQASRDAGARCAVARVFNVAGPYMTKPELYALGDFIARARAHEPIVIRAVGRVERSYVLAADVVTVALSWLLDGRGPDEVVFDTAGDEVVEVEDLARRVASVLGVPDLPVERTLEPGAPADVYVGDGTRFAQLAAAYGSSLASLNDQIAATAAHEELCTDGR